MKDKLRELVDELMSACEMIGYATSGNERANHRATRDKIKAEILAILAEPDSAPTESGSFFQPSGSEPDQLP